MMKSIRLLIPLTLSAVTAWCAQPPGILQHQGFVRSDGVPFDGTGSFKFAFVNDDGSSTYWSNDGTSVGGAEPTAAVSLTVSHGLYSLALGDTGLANMTQAVPASVFADHADVRLRVWFDDGVHGVQALVPDQRIASVGYALHAGSVGETEHLALSATTGPQSGVLTINGVPAAQMYGAENGFFGGAGNFATTGIRTTGLGQGALSSNTTGSANTASGAHALTANTSGTANTASGALALFANTTGNYNTASGGLALLANTTGSFNTGLGFQALNSNSTGDNNTGIGVSALYNTTGTNNVALGFSAGASLTDGDNNVAIANPGQAGESGTIRLGSPGTHTKTILAGDVGIGTDTPGFTLHVNGSAGKPGGGSWSIASDARLKEVGEPFTRGLDAIEHLQPKHYRYSAGNALGLPGDRDYVGLIAQEVEAAIPEAIERNNTGYLHLNNDPIIWTMLNASKELKAENANLRKTVADLEARLTRLESALAAAMP